jgi:hypothetical protein
MATSWTGTWQLGTGRNTLGRSPFAQGFALLLIAAVAVLMIPLLILAVVFAILAVGALRVRTWMFRQKQPNGMLDGRRNVRVRVPEISDDVPSGS